MTTLSITAPPPNHLDSLNIHLPHPQQLLNDETTLESRRRTALRFGHFTFPLLKQIVPTRNYFSLSPLQRRQQVQEIQRQVEFLSSRVLRTTHIRERETRDALSSLDGAVKTLRKEAMIAAQRRGPDPERPTDDELYTSYQRQLLMMAADPHYAFEFAVHPSVTRNSPEGRIPVRLVTLANICRVIPRFRLEGIHIGPLLLYLNLAPGLGPSNRVKVLLAIGRSPTASELIGDVPVYPQIHPSGHYHFHIRPNGGICFGNFLDPIVSSITRGNLLGAFGLLDSLVRRYNENSPYVNAQEWRGREVSVVNLEGPPSRAYKHDVRLIPFGDRFFWRRDCVPRPNGTLQPPGRPGQQISERVTLQIPLGLEEPTNVFFLRYRLGNGLRTRSAYGLSRPRGFAYTLNPPLENPQSSLEGQFCAFTGTIGRRAPREDFTNHPSNLVSRGEILVCEAISDLVNSNGELKDAQEISQIFESPIRQPDDSRRWTSPRQTAESIPQLALPEGNGRFLEFFFGAL